MNIKVDLKKYIIIIRNKNNVFFIHLDDIWYIEKFGNKTIIKTKYDEFETRISLKSLIDVLPRHYVRSNRSYIINTKAISKLEYVKNDLYKVFYDNDENDFAFSSKKSIDAIIG